MGRLLDGGGHELAAGPESSHQPDAAAAGADPNGTAMHAAGLVQTPNGPQQDTPSSDATNQYLYAGTRTQPTIHNLDVVIYGTSYNTIIVARRVGE